MKTQVLKFITVLESKLGINIPIKIKYESDNNLYGSITIGHCGFMIYQTWQPKDDTTFQFKINGETGQMFDYQTDFVNHKPIHRKVMLGDFKEEFINRIIDSIKGCIYWSNNKSNKKFYKNVLKKIKLLQESIDK